MNTEQQSIAELIDKPAEATESIAVPAEWENDFKSINDLLATMESWKSMSIEKDGITKVTANRVAAKKLRIRIEDLRKELGRAIMLRKANVDAFADKLRVAITSVEVALGVIEDAHKAKVKAEPEQREAEAAKLLNERISRLEALGYIPADVAAVGKMTPFQFQMLLDARRKIFEAAELTRVRMSEILSVGPDDISESAVGIMTAVEFSTYLKCHRVTCEVAERERAEAEQAENDRVAALEREADESRKRLAEYERKEAARFAELVRNSSPDVVSTPAPKQESPDPRELPIAEQSTNMIDVVSFASGVRGTPEAIRSERPVEIDDPQCKMINVHLSFFPSAEELNDVAISLGLTGEVYRVFQNVQEVKTVWTLDRSTGFVTLKSFDGLEVDRPF